MNRTDVSNEIHRGDPLSRFPLAFRRAWRPRDSSSKLLMFQLVVDEFPVLISFEGQFT